MKKLFLTLTLPFALLSASFGQITRDASDSIVLERMSLETRPHTVYAKTDTAAIATKAGELLKLDYPCWIYYIHYEDQADTNPANQRYLVVNESSGNVLEVRTKNDIAPPNLAAWTIVPFAPIVRLAWTGTLNCAEYLLDSVVVTNKSNGEKVVFYYPDTEYVYGIKKDSIPMEYGDTLIVQGFINDNDAFQYKKTHIITLTDDTLLTFAFFNEQSFVDTSEITIIDSLKGVPNYSPCYYNSLYYLSSDCAYSQYKIVNTQSDLDSLFACDTSFVPPDVDFLTQSLILLRGNTYETIKDYPNFFFIKKCNDDYVIRMDIESDRRQMISAFYWMVIVDEIIQSQAQIKLIINFGEKKLCY